MREYRELMAQQRTKEFRMMIFGIVILLVLCIGAALIERTLPPPVPELTPTVTSPIAVASPPTNTPMPTSSPVLIPTNTPVPTETPLPTPVSEVTPTATPSPEPSLIPPSDPQADVVFYGSLAPVPVERVPAGVDIRAASVGDDLQVTLQTPEGVPPELSGWAEGQVLLWIALYDPIPDPPTTYTEWLFALDLDGDIRTGRPVGSLRINPDLGVEVAVGIYYDPDSGEYEVYSLVWDPAQGSWADGPAGTRFILSESRTLVGLALPLDTLTQSAAQITGVTVVPGAVKGRAAALATVEERIIDFYPDRPD